MSTQNSEVRDNYKRLYESRDLEIKNLWQRSIFLATFLVLCFTGYGFLIRMMFDLECDTTYKIYNIAYCSGVRICDVVEYDTRKIDYLHGIAILISLVGIILSILWIAMAKGSKAWYEVYENVIKNFEKNNSYALGLDSEYRMGNYGLPTRDLNSGLFSTKAGAYSPSKINIVIGQVSLIIWFITFVVHVVVLWKFILFGIKDVYFYCLIVAIVGLLGIIVWLAGQTCCMQKKLIKKLIKKLKVQGKKKKKKYGFLDIRSEYLSSNTFNRKGEKIDILKWLKKKTEEADK